VAADAIDAELLEVDPGTPLLRERRSTRDAGGALFEYAEDRYLPSLSAFTIDNSRDGSAPAVRRPGTLRTPRV
jgi:GntR family transcriptional regulator